jgi:hypothetical protein
LPVGFSDSSWGSDPACKSACSRTCSRVCSRVCSRKCYFTPTAISSSFGTRYLSSSPFLCLLWVIRRCTTALRSPKSAYGTVLYHTVRCRTGGQLSDGDDPPVGTPYKVKSCPHRGPCDVARSQRFPSVGALSSPPNGGDESVPYKVGLIRLKIFRRLILFEIIIMAA